MQLKSLQVMSTRYLGQDRVEHLSILKEGAR